MRVVVSGYYGYENAGDEAVLAALLEHVSGRLPGCTFVVTSGAPAQTQVLHAAPEYSLRAVAREDFKSIWRELQSCDLFISGGGSLLQDATSLRNIVYYTGLIRMAHFARKPVMIYAQGVGPLRRGISRKLTRAALQHASTLVTVRDPESRNLLHSIGVRKNIEITADPVWALEPSQPDASKSGTKTWCVALRSWLGAESPAAEKTLLQAIRTAAQQQRATLKFLAMQPGRDDVLLELLGVEAGEFLPTNGLHPRQIMALAGNCELMIAMRLHALIFAAAQGVPCVAVSYDPKVESLVKLIGAPVIRDASAGELAKLQAADSTAPASSAFIDEMKAGARRNAELAATLTAK